MKISWKWLGELVDLNGLTPEEAGHRLTMAGLELEGIEVFGKQPALDTVVVGLIESIVPHPQADKLVVCQVSTGEGTTHQIVCGARNMKAGDRVPVALPGTVMPDGMTIAVAPLRGVESQGMLCSARELELSRDHEGLLILPASAALGRPVLEAFELEDTVLDISLTPNRPDGLSHIGISRDLSAVTGRARRWPAELEGWRAASRGGSVTPGPLAFEGATVGGAIEDHLTVELEDAEGCPRYAVAVMTGLRVAPSPAWMRARLMAIGQRPINNLVDVTNLVLHECGQPLHAFDLAKLRGGVLKIRKANEGETIVTIDDAERTLTRDDVVIADAQGPVAIAGVMGGRDSGVTAETTSIAIECAYFNPTCVRKTARRLALHSESSHRFERGIDPNGVEWFIRRAIALFIETQRELGVTPTVAATVTDVYPRPVAPIQLGLSAEAYRGHIGVSVEPEAMAAVLESLDIRTEVDGARVVAHVPTFRPDIERPVDLIEEIARIQGMDAITAELPPGVMGFSHSAREEAADRARTIVPLADERDLRLLRERLLARGLREAVNYNFARAADTAALGFAEDDVRCHPIAVRNPISEVADCMRTTLMQGLLTNLVHNRSRRLSDVALFELGRVYLREHHPVAPLPATVGGVRWGTHVEPIHLAALVCGNVHSHFTGGHRHDPWDLLGLVIDLVSAATRAQARVLPMDAPPAMLHPFAAGRVMVGDVELGWVGALHPELLEGRDIDVPVYAFELDVDVLLGARAGLPRMQPIPRYPSSQRDFALIVDAAVPYARLEQALAEFGDARIVASALFDLYASEQIGEGKKSFAVRLTLQDPEATLSEEVLTSLQERVVSTLTERLGAQIRG